MLCQIHAFDKFLNYAAKAIWVDTAEAAVHFEGLPAREVFVQGVKLGAVADPLTHLLQVRDDIVPINRHLPSRGRVVTSQHPERCRFSGTVHTQQTKTLTGADSESDVVNGQLGLLLARFLRVDLCKIANLHDVVCCVCAREQALAFGGDVFVVTLALHLHVLGLLLRDEEVVLHEQHDGKEANALDEQSQQALGNAGGLPCNIVGLQVERRVRELSQPLQLGAGHIRCRAQSIGVRTVCLRDNPTGNEGVEKGRSQDLVENKLARFDQLPVLVDVHHPKTKREVGERVEGLCDDDGIVKEVLVEGCEGPHHVDTNQGPHARNEVEDDSHGETGSRDSKEAGEDVHDGDVGPREQEQEEENEPHAPTIGVGLGGKGS
eukprot:comp24269_c0_seq1/m.45257 comp24269_c0_seq1/g.45257  ORF comp24269_c0_seq1/g.45257 comp24269_c0_seq1/m.45257 type:complete len:377 (+) comp24269_c0_seq1:783-1913(+)